MFFFLSVKSFSQDSKPFWRKMGDEVSKILPSGQGDIGADFNFEKYPVENRGDRWGGPFAGTSHILCFSPTYLATALVETALSPVLLTTAKITEESEETTEKTGNRAVEEENERLKNEVKQLKKREAELLEKLKSQAEKFIESYNPNSKGGLVGA